MKKIFFCIMILLALMWGRMPEAWGASLESQEALAREYQFRIARAPASDARAREELLLRLIRECPATKAAEEAYWTLSNLYLDGFAEPREERAREVLERFLERYPSSRWVPHFENRLAWLKGERR